MAAYYWLCVSVAVINYLLKTSTSCIFTPEEHLAKYEKPFDVVLASGMIDSVLPLNDTTQWRRSWRLRGRSPPSIKNRIFFAPLKVLAFLSPCYDLHIIRHFCSDF